MNDRRIIPLDADQALRVISAEGCYRSTHAPPACLTAGRSPLARFEADRACPPCIAFGALHPGSEEPHPADPEV